MDGYGWIQIREYHRRHPAARYVDTTDEYEELLKVEPAIEFAGEVKFFLYISLRVVEIEDG